MHVVALVHVPTLFSMRQLSANQMAARTLPCPTPAALKLAMLSGLIWRDGEERAQEHLEWLAPLGVAWRPPARAGLTALTVRAWKVTSDDERKKGSPPLTMSVGMREYLSFSDSFGLALLDVP